MYAKFTISVSGANSIITTAPTLASEVGSYSLTVRQCLVDAGTTKCVTCVVPVIVGPCVINSVKILQSSPSGILSAQTWFSSNLLAFTYQLAVDTTSTCGYQPTAWTATTTSTNNPASATNF
jgi:hypothetical protein